MSRWTNAFLEVRVDADVRLYPAIRSQPQRLPARWSANSGQPVGALEPSTKTHHLVLARYQRIRKLDWLQVSDKAH
jgi:hypothetical protein